MSKIRFTKEEIAKLSKNKYIKHISEKGITYTDEFKKIFISESETGKSPRMIFEENGFDIEIIGMKRVQTSAYRWRNVYKTQGVLGLKDSRKGNSGRPRDRELTPEERYARLEAENKLLKAENELLKKLDMIERMAIKKK